MTGAVAAGPPVGDRATDLEAVRDTCARLGELVRDLAATGSGAIAVGADHGLETRLAPVVAALEAELDRLRAEIARAQTLQMHRLDLREPLMVNLGSGPNHIDGWVDVDLFGGDVVADLRRPLPFGDDSVACINAAHVLEHLRHPDEAWALLAECRRILRRGGRLRLVVPDIETYVDAYRDADADEWAELAQARGWDACEPRLDALVRYAGASHHPAGFFGHQHGYDRQSLVELVASVGFGPIRLCSHQGSSDDRLRVDDRSRSTGATWRGRPLDLFVEAFALF